MVGSWLVNWLVVGSWFVSWSWVIRRFVFGVGWCALIGNIGNIAIVVSSGIGNGWYTSIGEVNLMINQVVLLLLD